MLNKKFVIFIISIFVIYLVISFTISNEKFRDFKSFLNLEQKEFIKKYFFPYKQISLLEKKISGLEEKVKKYRPFVFESELYFKKSLEEVKIKKEKEIELSNNKILQKYKILNGFYTGINKIKPGGYVDFYKNHIIIMSARGILAHNNDLNNNNTFKQIKNNIDDFISLDQYKNDLSKLLDLFIYDNKIFISYADEIKENCLNTSVLYANMNYEDIKFKKLFSSKQCIQNPKGGYFFGARSGGRLENFDKNHLLLTTGEYGNRDLAQEKDNINGKVIKINIHNSSYQIVSMGHRNPQGMYFDKDQNLVLLSEHGPYGGDEINLIDINQIDYDDPLNFGWAISSYGEHYDAKTKENEEMYRKYPLYKSHKKYGYIEPIKHFSPAIAPSQIIKINENKYILAGMKSKSLFFFELDNKIGIKNLKEVKIFERIRDLKYHKKTIYLFLEDTGSIATISVN